MTLREEIRKIVEQIQRDAVIYVQDKNGDPNLIDALAIADKILEVVKKEKEE